MEVSAASSHALSHDLRAAVAGLEQVDPWIGLWRFVSLGMLFLSFVVLAWSASTFVGFMGFTAIAAFPYAFWFVCTHDTTHQTLTAWHWFDTWMPRIISYPMLWPYGTYARLHRLHHAWNGIDLRDPERVQWTVAEYQQARPWQQWYVNHQWVIDIFLLGGVGLIAKTVYQGMKLQSHAPDLRRSLLLDGLGIMVMQSGLAIAAITHGRFVDYLLFWLVLERIIGIVQQTRDHLEHYALWKTDKNHQITQLYACRNLVTSRFIFWLMGGLPDHALHHTFPAIPFHHLPEAFRRTQAVLEHHQKTPLVRDPGYLRTAFRLATQVQLIH